MSIFDLFKKIETESEKGGVEYIVACLGNPGEKYERTKHNAGFMTADYLSQKQGFKINKIKFHSLSGIADIGGRRVLFLKPQTYMNESGLAVKEAADFYKINTDKIIVICDDITLDPGRIRIRLKGSDGGHNGLKSIIEHFSSDLFKRVRIGVGGKPHPDYDLADWVLSPFSSSSQERVFESFGKISEALILILKGEEQKAMNLYNV